MKNVLTILGMLTILLTANMVTAACDPTANAYTHGNDNGIPIKFVHTCFPASRKLKGQLCIYKGQNKNKKAIAAIHGDIGAQEFTSAHLTRQRIIETTSQLKTELKTPSLDSLYNAEKFVFSMNKKSMKGVLTYNMGGGVDPYTGIETTEDIPIQLKCK